MIAHFLLRHLGRAALLAALASFTTLGVACGGGGGGSGPGGIPVAGGGGGGTTVGGGGPQIASVSPASGAPGDPITISGSGFAALASGETVRFGGVTAGITGAGTMQITALVPSLSPGPAAITVEVGGATSPAAGFTVVAPPANAPVLTALGPTSGPVGTSVLLGGTNLGGVVSVTIGGVSVATTAGPRFVVPQLAAGPHVIVAIDGAGLSSGPQAFVVTPVLTGVTPGNATPGGSITISGSNFGTLAVAVRFGPSAVASVTPTAGGTSISVAVPSPFPSSLPATVTLTVATNPGKIQQAVSNGLTFTVDAPAGGQPAAVTTLQPASGPVGTVVVANGSGFGGSPTVTVGGLAASISASSATSVTFAIPVGLSAGARAVVVTGPGGASSPVTFQVTPTVASTSLVSIDPPGGLASQLVNIRGAGFDAGAGAPSVTFGGFAASIVTYNDASIAARVPAGAATGSVQVVVTPAGGGASNGLAFTKAAAFTSGSANTFSSAAGAMTTARVGHTATLLASGKVLIAGGDASAGTTGLSSAEVFDPATGLFTAAANLMTVPRQAHSATRLPDGRVLLVGGYGNPGSGLSLYFATDIYDPATNSFTRGPDLLNLDVRDSHVAVPLANGDVLVAGGETLDLNFNVVPSESCQRYIYAPGGTGSFQVKASLNLPRLQSAAVPSFGGAILVGGQDEISELASAEIHDQVANTWTKGASPFFIMTIPRVLPTCARLANGDVVAAGGFSPNGIAAADPMTTLDVMPTDPSSATAGQFAIRAPASMQPRVGHSMTVLADDRVLLAGSARSLAAAQSGQVFNATMTSIGSSATMVARRFDHTATLLFDGRVLLTGGGGNATQVPGVFGISLTTTASAELYRP